jgi:cell division protein FtsL
MVAVDSTRPRAETRPQAQARPTRLPRSGALMAVLVATAALLPVVQSSNLTTTGYEIRALEQRRSDLQAAIYNAQVDIARLGSLERVEREARGRLGMVPAERAISVQVNVPPPAPRQIPARYVPQPPPAPARPTGLWERLLARLPFR